MERCGLAGLDKSSDAAAQTSTPPLSLSDSEFSNDPQQARGTGKQFLFSVHDGAFFNDLVEGAQ